ncbi:MAG: thioredoxin family protein [Thermoleophilia bacterium]|nr:thioredoxin family protein [Thermoleophilia bacterium]
MLHVKVLGAGCANCNKLYETVKKAADSLGAEVKLEKVSDYPEMMKYGLLQTPGLVINERLVLSGKVPSVSEMASILTTAMSKDA